LIQNAWAQGIEWGGGLLGFPFWILAALFFSAFVTALFVLDSKHLGRSSPENDAAGAGQSSN